MGENVKENMEVLSRKVQILKLGKRIIKIMLRRSRIGKEIIPLGWMVRG